MKKIFLALLCLLLVTCCASVACASEDVGNIATNESVELPVNQDMNISVDMDDFNTTADVTGGIDLDQNALKNTDAADGSSVDAAKDAPSLQIKGPKFNDDYKKIKGPKVGSFDLPQIKKDTFHYAKLFYQHPEWSMFDCLLHLYENTHYSSWDIANIMSQAHNIALHKYNGTDMVINNELTVKDVNNYLTKHLYFFWRFGDRGC